ncbi:MAG: BlaI/MecI/CopY family transcriptional regulator [Roseburia sp.]
MLEYSLSDCEELVMKCIWDSENDIGVQQITQMVNEKYGKDWKQQTVSTFLVRLVKKNYADMYRKGRNFFYHPKIEKAEYCENLVKNYVDFWNNGSVADFISDLYKNGKLSSKEKKEIKDAINNL